MITYQDIILYVNLIAPQLLVNYQMYIFIEAQARLDERRLDERVMDFVSGLKQFEPGLRRQRMERHLQRN